MTNFVGSRKRIRVLKFVSTTYPFPLPLKLFFPQKHVWCSKIPPRVAFFSWTAALDEILTLAFFSLPRCF